MKFSTPSGLLSAIRRRRSQPKMKKAGDRPGAQVFEGLKMTDEVTFEVFDYSVDHFEHLPGASIEDCHKHFGRANPTWVHVTGLHEVEKVVAVGKVLEIPELYLEDILSTNGRAKIEITDEGIFIQIKTFDEGHDGGRISMQQMSIYVTSTMIVSFAEGPTTILEPIIKRLKNLKGRIRARGLDYLLWALLDTITDHTIAVISLLESHLLELDRVIQEDSNAVSAADLYALKHEVTSLLHLVRPNREIIHALRQTSHEIISEDLLPYLSDLTDHTLAVFDECQVLSEYAQSMREYLLTELNQRMNHVMQVFTCISTVFLPLTFLAGVYGMNFVNMPELHQPWAYPLLWGVFLLMGFLLVLLFRKKRWL